ncbi:MAG: anthranilate phosphoribosyltransferase [Syntrophorhabdales bacterium]
MEGTEKLKKGESLTYEEALALFDAMFDGFMDEAEIEDVLLLLTEKGETEEEIAGAATSLLARSIRLPHTFERLLDTCGTGGDNSGTFNISTTSAIVCSLFIPVAKHGNRAVSSRSGSADVLEALRIPIDLDAQGASRFLKEKNFVFIFAQKFLPAMRFVMGVRKRIGRKTLFNLLGPLCNPARPDTQMIGIFKKEAMSTYLGALEILGIPNVMLVSSDDGLDEISLSAPTVCFHKRGPSVRRFEFDPRDFGIHADMQAIKGYEPVTNARIMKETLLGRHPDLVNVVAINAAFALMAADVEEGPARAFLLAREAILSGKAYERLMELAS